MHTQRSRKEREARDRSMLCSWSIVIDGQYQYHRRRKCLEVYAKDRINVLLKRLLLRRIGWFRSIHISVVIGSWLYLWVTLLSLCVHCPMTSFCSCLFMINIDPRENLKNCEILGCWLYKEQGCTVIGVPIIASIFPNWVTDKHVLQYVFYVD